MNYKAYNFKTFNLYTIKTDKFKNCHVEVIFRQQITKENIMKRKFLIELMSYSMKKYPTQRELSVYLEELYNASYYGLISRVGGTLFTSLCYDFLNPKYCEENSLDKMLEFIIDSIMHPNITDEKFDPKAFKLLQSIIINEIKSAKDNIKREAYRALFKHMDEDAYLSYDMIGTVEEAQKITEEDIFKEYQTMLDSDLCDIYIVGNLDMDVVANYFATNLKLSVIKEKKLPLFCTGKSRSKILTVKETADINQANLLVGLDVHLTDEEKDAVGYVYNALLGSGSLNTKLGQNLRQDNSLCYTVNSIYQKYDGVIVIYAGIDEENAPKAINLIKKSLKEMISDVSQTDLESAKKNLITSLKMISDSPASLVNNYQFCNIAGLKPINKRIEDINAVSILDIKKMAKKVKINTIYLLSGVK